MKLSYDTKGFKQALEKIGCPSRVLTSIEMRTIAEPYIRRRAIRPEPCLASGPATPAGDHRRD